MILKPPLFAKPIHGHPLGPDGGLCGCWPMNEGAYNKDFNKVFDLSGNGNTGDFNGTILWRPGETGPVLDAGTDPANYIEIPYKPSLNITGPLTIIVKCYPTGVENYPAIISRGYTTEYALLFEGATLKPRLYISGLGTTTTSAIAINNWSTVAVTHSQPNANFYINGKWDSAKTINDSPDGDTNNVLRFFLEVEAGYNFDGYISYVMIYNRVLSASEIALLYREPFCMFEREPIELWSAATQGGVPAGTILPQITTAYMRVTA